MSTISIPVQVLGVAPQTGAAPPDAPIRLTTMKTLLLDLGTQTGWAVLEGGTLLQSGTLPLATEDELAHQRRQGQERTCDLRFARLYGLILQHIDQGTTRIVFEDVLFSNTQMQTQLWASLRTAIWAAALKHPGLSVFGIPVATLKRFATGNGRAQKADMAQALIRAAPDYFPNMLDGYVVKADRTLADDNEVDAIWLARYVQSVDRGERSFLGVRQRKLAAKVDRREKKAERRRAAKAKREEGKANAMAMRAPTKAAIRSMGKCCGIWRRQHKRRACGSNIVIPKPPTPAPATDASSAEMPPNTFACQNNLQAPTNNETRALG